MRIGLAVRVARMWEIRKALNILIRTPQENRSFEVLVVDGRVITTWILEKWFMRVWTGFS
jgi:cytidylate kinase